jgi:UDP-glucose 4-epimerase
VSDVVEAIMLSLRNEGARGVFSIGNGEGVTINRLARLILKLMGREDSRPIYAPPRPGDIRHSIADISRAQKELGFKPKLGLEVGINELIRHNVIRVEWGKSRLSPSIHVVRRV